MYVLALLLPDPLLNMVTPHEVGRGFKLPILDGKQESWREFNAKFQARAACVGTAAAYKALSEALRSGLDDAAAGTRAELEAKYHHLGSPFRTAESFGILDIIDPRETRGILCDWIEDAWEVLQGDRARH